MQASFTGFHRVQDGIINFAHTWLNRLSQTDSACHICTIPFIASAHINGNQLATLDTAFIGVCVWHRCMRAGGYNGLKRHSVSTQFYHFARNLPLDLFLRHSRLYPLTDVRKGFIGNRNSFFEEIKLIRLLDLTHLLNTTVLKWQECVYAIARPADLFILAKADCRRFKAYLFPAIFLCLSDDSRSILPRLRDNYFPANGLTSGNFRIQRIGHEDLLALSHQ